MAIERNWATISIGPISVSGAVITVPTTFGLKAKQKIVLSKPLIVSRQFEIKRVMDSTSILVGDPNKPIGTTADATEFDGGSLLVFEQERNTIGGTPILRAVYDEEPACALRVTPVDWLGNSYSNNNPQPVKILSSNKGRCFRGTIDRTPSVLIPPPLDERVSFLIKNISETQAIWIGFDILEADDDVGYPLVPGEFIAIDLNEEESVWAVSDIDGATISIIEVSRNV